MTLIFTCMTPQWIAQVSDCRLSYGSSGVSPKDIARKLLFYNGHGARLTISYTGLAEIEEPDRPRRALEVWLAETIPPLAAQAQSVPHLAHLLMQRLDVAVENTRQSLKLGATPLLSVILAGFIGSSPPAGLICLSNFQVGGLRLPLKPGSEPIPVVVPAEVGETIGRFKSSVVQKSSGMGLLIHGDHTSISTTVATELQAGLRIAGDPEAARSVIVRAIQSIAGENPNGTVSADCWSWIGWVDRPVQTFDSTFERPESSLLIRPLSDRTCKSTVC